MFRTILQWADEEPLSGKVRTVCLVLLFVLLAKVLVSIVFQYPFYFPPDFDSAFLTGRRGHFHGIYRTAFYTHIIVGPLTILFGFVLIVLGKRHLFRRTHRWLGRVQILIIVSMLVPSGLVMATQAYTGPLAGWGLAMLAIATGISAIMVVYHARARRFDIHQRWATRCYILLCSPLLLRLMSGAVIVTGLESQWTYRISAWLSWILPLLAFEVWLRQAQRN